LHRNGALVMWTTTLSLMLVSSTCVIMLGRNNFTSHKLHASSRR
jgi:hypothetical protein